MTLAISILVLEVGVIVHLLVYTVISGISPVPTTPRVKAKMLEAGPERFKGTILDLGSGWGTLAYAFAKQYPEALVIGYELSPIPWCFCKVRQWYKPQPNLLFQRKDYRKVSFTQADLIVCYLFTRGMRELRPKLEQELTPGAWVISNTFAVPEWEPERIDTAADQYETRIFIYQMPVKLKPRSAPSRKVVVKEYDTNPLVVAGC